MALHSSEHIADGVWRFVYTVQRPDADGVMRDWPNEIKEANRETLVEQKTELEARVTDLQAKIGLIEAEIAIIDGQ